MKRAIGIAVLALSVVLNAYLVRAVWSRTTPPAESPRTDQATSSSNLPDSAPAARAAADGATAPAGASDWASLLNLDARAVADHLKADGVPDALARTLISQLLEGKVAARSHELKDALPKVPYWSPAQLAPNIFNDPQAVAELRQMRDANVKALAEIFGPGAASDPMEAAQQRSQYGALSQEKIDQIALINGDYNEMNTAVRTNMQGITLPEDRDRMAYLEKSKLDDIRALLTPDEFQDYLYRSSSTGSSLRGNLALFQPTEAEFKALFAIQYPFDQKYNLNIGVTQGMLTERAEAQRQLTEDLKAAIDPSRLADYEKLTDGNYRNAYNTVARLELPKDHADMVWQTQKDIQLRAATIRNNGELSAAARNSQLGALQAEAAAKISSALGGPKGLDAYKQSGGQWIQALVPAAAAGRGQ